MDSKLEKILLNLQIDTLTEARKALYENKQMPEYKEAMHKAKREITVLVSDYISDMKG